MRCVAGRLLPKYKAAPTPGGTYSHGRTRTEGHQGRQGLQGRWDAGFSGGKGRRFRRSLSRWLAPTLAAPTLAPTLGGTSIRHLYPAKRVAPTRFSPPTQDERVAPTPPRTYSRHLLPPHLLPAPTPPAPTPPRHLSPRAPLPRDDLPRGWNLLAGLTRGRKNLSITQLSTEGRRCGASSPGGGLPESSYFN